MDQALAMGISAYWRRSEARKDARFQRRNHLSADRALMRWYKGKYEEAMRLYQDVKDRIEDFSKYSCLLPPREIRTGGYRTRPLLGN